MAGDEETVVPDDGTETPVGEESESTNNTETVVSTDGSEGEETTDVVSETDGT